MLVTCPHIRRVSAIDRENTDASTNGRTNEQSDSRSRIAELSSLQIRYHHYIAVGLGISEIVWGLFKIVVKFVEKV